MRRPWRSLGESRIQARLGERTQLRNMNEEVVSISLTARYLVCVRKLTCMISFGSPSDPVNGGIVTPFYS